jgi:hypothetical protein
LLQAIITDPRLSPTAKVVAGALLDCLNWQTGRCYPSLAHLAKRVGKKRGVISAAICRLIECGWLFRPRRRGASSYRFAFGRLQEDVQKNGNSGVNYLPGETRCCPARVWFGSLADIR